MKKAILLCQTSTKELKAENICLSVFTRAEKWWQ